MKRIISFFFVIALAVPFSFSRAALSESDQKILASGPDLSIGTSNHNVELLQQFLVDASAADPSIYPEKYVSGYFGTRTKAALARWQAKQNITPTSGYFGPKTKAVVASFIGTVLKTSSTTTPTSANVPKVLPPLADPIKVDDHASYRSALFGASAQSNFSLQGLTTLQSTYGKVITVPGIMASLAAHLDAKDTAAASKDRASLLAWRSYFTDALAKLSIAQVPASVAKNQEALVRWFSYNISFIDSITAPSLSAGDVRSANKIYSDVYAANGNLIAQGFTIAASESLWHKNVAWWHTFLPTAYAQVSLRPLGGIISITDLCTTGELLVIEGPAPGATFLYWTVYAANPFLYKVVSDGNWIIANAIPGPGLCNKGYVNYTEGESFIAYFGTSLEP